MLAHSVLNLKQLNLNEVLCLLLFEMCSRGKRIVNLVLQSNNKECTENLNEDLDLSSEGESLPEGVDLTSLWDSDDSGKDPDFEPMLPGEGKGYKDVPSTSSEDNIRDVDQNKVLVDINEQHRKIKGDTRKKRNERKERRNLGKSYETLSGKLIREKSLKPLTTCRNRCIEKVSQELRQNVFTSFWAMDSYNRRVQFIASQMEVMDKKSTRFRNEDSNRQRYRQSTVLYHLPSNGSNIRVCKTCFVKTFDVSNKFIETVLNKKRASVSGIVNLDQRGNHSNKKKITVDEIENARRHILSIPSYESHYTRRDSSKRYLPSHYTLASLYHAYKEKYPQKPVNRKLYEKLFHELNIKIKKPKKDTCSTCDKLAMQIKMAGDKNILQEELAQHHLEADLGYTSKSTDKELSKNDPTKKTITFDLQQCLPTPDIQNNIAFYKRQLWTFNLTVHDCDASQAYCYIWHEAQAKRGGNEIGSCLYQFLTKDMDETVEHVVMYSDCCGGQNKNSHIAAMCMVALQDSRKLQVIDHKFLISGHTHMECDTDHSLIEKQKKKFNGQVEHPHDWANLIRQTGKKKPFIVKEMEKDDFHHFSGLLNGPLINRKTDSDGNKINWRHLRWIRYEKGRKALLVKKTFSRNEPFKVLDFERRGRQTEILRPQKAYKGPLPISIEKKQHLLELVPYISSSLKDFYLNLKTDQDAIDAFSDSDEEEA